MPEIRIVLLCGGTERDKQTFSRRQLLVMFIFCDVPIKLYFMLT